MNITRTRSEEKKGFWQSYSQDHNTQLYQLQAEATFLQGLILELEQDVREMKQSQHLAAKARTRMGRLRSYAGVVFSIVLLARLVSSFSQVLGLARGSSTRPKMDVVTLLITWLTGSRVVTREDADAWFNLISLSLTALLSVSQIRTLLWTVGAVQSRLLRLCRCCLLTPESAQITVLNMSSPSRPRKLSHPPEDSTMTLTDGEYVVHQLLASLIGCYCLACVVLTKLMLPPDYRVSFSTVATDFAIRNETIQAVYLGTAGLTLGTLGVLLSIQRQHVHRYLRGGGVSGKIASSSTGTWNMIMDP